MLGTKGYSISSHLQAKSTKISIQCKKSFQCLYELCELEEFSLLSVSIDDCCGFMVLGTPYDSPPVRPLHEYELTCRETPSVCSKSEFLEVCVGSCVACFITSVVLLYSSTSDTSYSKKTGQL